MGESLPKDVDGTLKVEYAASQCKLANDSTLDPRYF